MAMRLWALEYGGQKVCLPCEGLGLALVTISETVELRTPSDSRFPRPSRLVGFKTFKFSYFRLYKHLSP
ncbi:hypothetical protein EVAR_58576_1 [Eumeta japonica]|uniref:Uncharacterized protein n=1 Tax=Eumeta variegata TaxID=151549 RepID=A0A4C1Z6F9_EUMVA|nr:hypothetical protein EVAR_58576_1 [Eumeta japonica]